MSDYSKMKESVVEETDHQNEEKENIEFHQPLHQNKEQIEIDFISPIAKVEETNMIETVENPIENHENHENQNLPLNFEPKVESSYSIGDFIKSASYVRMKFLNLGRYGWSN